ncbi:hypothetical protein EV361DRAFT_982105, partial [Lentinula raphanica]
MLNVTKNNDGTRRPGIEQVSKSRLDDFLNGAAESGPGLRCTYLDTSGKSIDEFMASEWNQMFILNLAQECEAIVQESRDRKRFAKFNWVDIAKDRVYRVLLEISHAIPRPGETKKEAL